MTLFNYTFINYKERLSKRHCPWDKIQCLLKTIHWFDFQGIEKWKHCNELYKNCKECKEHWEKYKENLYDENRKKWKEYYEENDKILKKYLDKLKKEIELEEYNTIIREWIVLILISMPNLFIIICGFYGYIQNNFI